jgi:predicted O-methyltransferase YrrM
VGASWGAGQMTEYQFYKKPHDAETADQIKSAGPNIHPTTFDVLNDMYHSDKLFGTESDQPICIDKFTRISIKQGAIINNLMRAHSVKRSLEIGLAYGFSTVWMLDALRSQLDSLHIAIDPFEKSYWQGIGLSQVKRLDLEQHFKWVKDYSIHALSDLIRNQAQFDFIYIDGNHRFDDIVVDFYLSDEVLRTGGLMALDDVWMQSVRTAANFIVNNRAYKLVPQPVENMIVLKKQHGDDRDWHHFKSFKVASEGLLKRTLKKVPHSFGLSRARLRSLWPTKPT